MEDDSLNWKLIKEDLVVLLVWALLIAGAWLLFAGVAVALAAGGKAILGWLS